LVGCRDIHLKAAGAPDAWSAAKVFGAESIEVSVGPELSCPGLFHPTRKYSLVGEGAKVLRDDMTAAGCRIGAFMMSNRFDERLEQELEAARQVVQGAETVGASAVRIDLWPQKIKRENFLPFAISTCKQLCQAAPNSPVRFGIENHGFVTNDPTFLEPLFNEVGSPRLGLTLDTANFYWFGHPLNDLYPIYQKFAPKVVHTHCKNIRFPEEKKNVRREAGWGYDQYCCPVYEGDIDFRRILGILDAAHYSGILCVEDESLGRYPEGERGTIVGRELAFLKSLR
jgi:sugar phosphate isomerase/epimerase